MKVKHDEGKGALSLCLCVFVNLPSAAQLSGLSYKRDVTFIVASVNVW